MEQMNLFARGQEGVHTYRIPALLLSPRGALLAFAEARRNSGRDHGDIAIVLRRSEDQGRSWSAIQVVHDEPGEITIGNPCPFVDRRTGRIWLAMTRDNKRVLLAYSDDDGHTWSAPRDITESAAPTGIGWVATGPGVGIQLSGGRLLIPSDYRISGAGVPARRSPPPGGDGRHRGQPYSYSYCIYSDDGGASWSHGQPLPPGSNECQAVELRHGRIMMNMRMQKNHLGWRGVAFSADGGQSWQDFRHDDNLPCPTIQASLVRHEPLEQRLAYAQALLFSIPWVRKLGDGSGTGSRRRMTVKLSLDGGASWPCGKLIHAGPSAYSCLAVLPDGGVALLYEAGEIMPYERIDLAMLSVDELMNS